MVEGKTGSHINWLTILLFLNPALAGPDLASTHFYATPMPIKCCPLPIVQKNYPVRTLFSLF